MSKMRESPGSVQSTVLDCDRAVIRESPKGLVESAISDREPRAAKGRAKTAIADTAAKKNPPKKHPKKGDLSHRTVIPPRTKIREKMRKKTRKKRKSVLTMELPK